MYALNSTLMMHPHCSQETNFQLYGYYRLLCYKIPLYAAAYGACIRNLHEQFDAFTSIPTTKILLGQIRRALLLSQSHQPLVGLQPDMHIHGPP